MGYPWYDGHVILLMEKQADNIQLRQLKGPFEFAASYKRYQT